MAKEEKFFQDCEYGRIGAVRDALAAALTEGGGDMQAMLVGHRTSEVGNFTPLHIASRNGHQDIVKLLLATPGSDVNAKTTVMGWTALHLASSSGHKAVVQALVDTEGVDINAQDVNDGMTALHLASCSGHTDVVHILLGVVDLNLNAKNVVEGATALHLGSANGYEGVVCALLGTPGIKVDVQDSMGMTPLHVAARESQRKIIQHLLDAGSQVNLVDLNGETALIKAQRNGISDCVEILDAAARGSTQLGPKTFIMDILCCKPGMLDLCDDSTA